MIASQEDVLSLDKPLCDLSAVEISVALNAGTLTSRQMTEACLERITALNPAINAVVTPNPSALDEADRADLRRRNGQVIGALDGVPFLAKDNLETAGLRTTYGSRQCEDNVPDADAISVERMKRAGCVLLGKTNTPEFAHDNKTSNLVFGATRNPFDLSRTPGGSSGGTAAALAAGFAPIGLGTDLGGSIRIPAAMCALTGLRPSPGRVPVWPADFGWDTLVAHVHGPMARSAGDLGLMMAVLAGPDDRDPSSLPSTGVDYAALPAAIAGSRIAYCHDLGGVLPVEEETGAIQRAAVQRFTELGCQVEEASFDASDFLTIVRGTRGFGMVGRYARRVDAARDRLGPTLLAQVDDAFTLDLRTVTEAERARTAYYHRVRALLERFDYIVTPTLGAPAFAVDGTMPNEMNGKPTTRYADAYRFPYTFSITGLPVAAIPCGFTRAGLPVGLQIVARRHRDDLALTAAAAWMAAFPEHAAVPSRIAFPGTTP